jgi:uncharacterized protein with HEPN domain
MTKDPRLRLEDILRSIEWIELDTKEKTFEAFARNRKARQLVERNIEIISEASRHIPKQLTAEFPNIPWREIASIGNIMRHGYDQIEPKVLWDVVRVDLKPLKRAVLRMLRKISREP